MKNILLLCSLIMPFITGSKTGIKQGITGKIYSRHGNSMPSPGQPPALGRPFSTTIFIYRLTNRDQVSSTNGTTFDHIRTKLVAEVKSNADGIYTVALPVGTYSVFAGYSGSLYANNQDDKGNINPVKVVKESMTTCNIIISAQAVY